MPPVRDLGDWDDYLSRYHGEHPAITERVLAGAARRGRSPYEWLVEPIRQRRGPVLDLACGSAPTRDLLTETRALDGLAALSKANAFVVDTDERRVFRRQLTEHATRRSSWTGSTF